MAYKVSEMVPQYGPKDNVEGESKARQAAAKQMRKASAEATGGAIQGGASLLGGIIGALIGGIPTAGIGALPGFTAGAAIGGAAGAAGNAAIQAAEGSPEAAGTATQAVREGMSAYAGLEDTLRKREEERMKKQVMTTAMAKKEGK
jgi:hypothetical protein